MPHYVYLLVSEKSGRYYIGCSQDVDRRLSYHNSGRVKATRYQVPFHVVYTEMHETAKQARQREYHLKRLKSRRLLETLIASGVSADPALTDQQNASVLGAERA